MMQEYESLKDLPAKLLVKRCSLEKLEKALKEAVGDENFEMAARVRDAIVIKNENIKNYGKKK